MTPSWYDVLDVDPGAGTDDIRAAWKTQIADLDPTDRRFRLLNQAAEVLLDPTRRAEHDALLAADDPDDPAPDDPAPATAEPGDAGRAGASAGERRRRGPRTRRAARTASATPEPPGPPGSPGPAEDTAGPAARASYAGWTPPAWLLAGLAVLVAVLVGLCAWIGQRPTDAALEADTRDARSAAVEAATTVLAYDYRDMAASRTAASAYLTPSFRQDYEDLFTVLEDNAEGIKPVVTAEEVASGIARVSSAGDRVSVLVFVNRETVNAASATPKLSQDQVTMQMQLTDGQWLVDDMVTSPALPAPEAQPSTEPSTEPSIEPSAEVPATP